MPSARSLIKDVDFYESGLQSRPMDIYIREECCSHWKWLEDAFTTCGVYRTEGAPGVGKSVMTYWYAIVMAKKAAKNLIYVNENEFTKSVVVYDAFEGKYKFVSHPGKKTIKALLSGSKFDILIIDGTVSKKLIKRALSLRDSASRSIVFCTSYRALSLSAEGTYVIDPRRFMVISWTRQHCLDAMNAGLGRDVFLRWVLYTKYFIEKRYTYRLSRRKLSMHCGCQYFALGSFRR